MQAGDAQGAVTALEALVAAGDRSPATLAALARALARSGNVAAAAQLLSAWPRNGPAIGPRSRHWPASSATRDAPTG